MVDVNVPKLYHLALHHLTNSSCCIVARSQSNIRLSLFVAFLIDSGTFSIQASISFGFRTFSESFHVYLVISLPTCHSTSASKLHISFAFITITVFTKIILLFELCLKEGVGGSLHKNPNVCVNDQFCTVNF